jgi:hypothetical protein
MTSLRRLIGLLLAHMLLKLVRLLRLQVRTIRLRLLEGPGWRRMVRARIAFRLIRLSRVVLGLSGIAASWLAD